MSSAAAGSTTRRRVRRRRSAHKPRPRALAGFGALLLAACVGWLWLVAEARGGDAGPASAMLLAAAAAYGAARLLTPRHAALVPALVVLAAGALAAAYPDTLLRRPLGNPFGYSNAIGSFYLVAAAAALMVAARTRAPALRAVAVAAAVAAATVPWLNATTTATVLVCLLPLGLLARSRRGVQRCVVAAAAATILAIGATVALGASYRPDERGGTLARVVDATLSERRPQLWRDALLIAAADPLTGAGPGRFPEESATARRDGDTRWPHNEPLHFAAEAGIPGAALLLAIFAWALAALWWGPADRGAAVAALALGAVGVHASIDYVLHFPAVTLAAAALAGAAAASPRKRRRPAPATGSGG